MAGATSGAASGASVILGFARETAGFGCGASGGTWNYYRANLPANLEFNRPEQPSGQVNAARVEEAGLPGSVTMAPDVGISMIPAQLLEFLENIHGAATKANPATGVYTYTFAFDPAAVRPSLATVRALPPTHERSRGLGMMLESLTLAMGGNAPIFARLSGLVQHGTKLGFATASGGNTGSYAGPEIRGPLATETAVWVSCTRDVLGGGIQFKVQQIAATPTYPGAAIDIVQNSDGEGVWQLAYDDDGAAITDLGFHGENYDPLEILWHGTNAGTLADIDIGDEWVFQPQALWADPTPTYISPAGPRLTSAPFFLDQRDVGGGTWFEEPHTSAQVVFGVPLTAEQGDGSKYPRFIDQDGIYYSTIQMVRRLRDVKYARKYEIGEALELRLRWEGQRIGTAGANREGMVVTCPNATIENATAPVASEGAVEQTVDFRARTNSAGDDPATIVITTSRDYTVTT